MTKKRAAGSGYLDTPLFPAVVSMRPIFIGDPVLFLHQSKVLFHLAFLFSPSLDWHLDFGSLLLCPFPLPVLIFISTVWTMVLGFVQKSIKEGSLITSGIL